MLTIYLNFNCSDSALTLVISPSLPLSLILSHLIVSAARNAGKQQMNQIAYFECDFLTLCSLLTQVRSSSDFMGSPLYAVLQYFCTIYMRSHSRNCAIHFLVFLESFWRFIFPRFCWFFFFAPNANTQQNQEKSK